MDLIKELSPYFVLLPFLIALPQLKSMPKYRRYLFGAIVLGIIGEILMVVAKKVWQNNMPVVHIYTLIEFCFLISVFHFGKPGLISKGWYRKILISFLLIGLGNIFFYQGILVWNSVVRSLEGILLMIFSLYFFYRLLQNLDVFRPEKTFMFWYSIAILVYFTGNLLLFIYSNQIIKIGASSSDGRALMDQIRIITYILNIFLYTLYSVAFLCKELKTIPKSSWSAP